MHKCCFRSLRGKFKTSIEESLMYRHPTKAVGAVAFLTVIGCQFAWHKMILYPLPANNRIVSKFTLQGKSKGKRLKCRQYMYYQSINLIIWNAAEDGWYETRSNYHSLVLRCYRATCQVSNTRRVRRIQAKICVHSHICFLQPLVVVIILSEYLTVYNCSDSRIIHSSLSMAGTANKPIIVPNGLYWSLQVMLIYGSSILLVCLATK